MASLRLEDLSTSTIELWVFSISQSSIPNVESTALYRRHSASSWISLEIHGQTLSLYRVKICTALFSGEKGSPGPLSQCPAIALQIIHS